MRGMPEVPAAERGIEVRRMNRIDANRVGAHLRDERDPLFVGAVVRWKLRRKLAGQGSAEIHCFYPERRPLAVASAYFNDAAPGARGNGCHRRPCMRREEEARGR